MRACKRTHTQRTPQALAGERAGTPARESQRGTPTPPLAASRTFGWCGPACCIAGRWLIESAGDAAAGFVGPDSSSATVGEQLLKCFTVEQRVSAECLAEIRSLSFFISFLLSFPLSFLQLFVRFCARSAIIVYRRTFAAAGTAKL